MALSNWDTFAVEIDGGKGKPSHGEYTSRAGVTVEAYKNWLYVTYVQKGPPKAPHERRPGEGDGRKEQQAHLATIRHGTFEIGGMTIRAKRGPKNGVYFVVEEWLPGEDDAPSTYGGMVGTGLYGYVGEEFVGVEQAELEFLRAWLDETYEGLVGYADNEDGSLRELLGPRPVFEDHIRAVDLGVGSRYNQGDACFAAAGVGAVQATAPGDAKTPTATLLMDQIFGEIRTPKNHPR